MDVSQRPSGASTGEAQVPPPQLKGSPATPGSATPIAATTAEQGPERSEQSVPGGPPTVPVGDFPIPGLGCGVSLDAVGFLGTREVHFVIPCADGKVATLQ